MEVLLVNPPSSYLGNPQALPPLGLLYLGAALERAGHIPTVVDLNLPGADIRVDGKFGLIGITCVTANYPVVRSLVDDLRYAYPGVPIVVGGPHVSIVPLDMIDLGADAACVGDGEEAIVALADGRLRAQSVLHYHC